MVKVAIDAMGGDNAPVVVVEGAVKAVKNLKGELLVVLTGPKDLVNKELAKLGEENNPLIQVVDAPQIVKMDESPAVVLKTKPESGLVKCVGLQKAGLVDASVSAGSSGAMMAASMMVLGRVAGCSRPAIACLIPSKSGTKVLLDCGANVDVKAQTLVDFAVSGSVFAEHALGYSNPTVGLLNIGEEAKKGPEVYQEAYQILKNSSLNFQGNVEGRDIIFGDSNVIVTGGFAGNIVLKLMEGFYLYHKELFGGIDSEAGRKFEEEWDCDNTGGGMLLGLKGHAFIAHGSANSQAISSALKTAYSFAKANVAEHIAEQLTGQSE